MLRLNGVSKTFVTDADRVVALQAIDLDLAKGDVLTIIGSNGAGKSTLLNLIAGTFPPTTGTIELSGEDMTAVAEHKRSRRIGRIVQSPLAGTAPTMSVAENLALASKKGRRGLRMALGKRTRKTFTDQLASLGLGLEQRLDCPVSLLSGGERQALTVLMATLVPPELLLLDEHTAALDPRNASMIVDLTRAFVGNLGLTTLMVTHNMEQAICVGNRLVMMHKGEFIHQLAGDEKAETTVSELVDLFAEHDVVDDELLLERVA